MNALTGLALLFCPGNRPDRFLKARDRSDVVILDLEDAVGTDEKDIARAAVVGAVATVPDAVVRVNAPGTPWYHADVAAVREAGFETIMLPKCSSADDLDGLSAFDVIALCETPAGVLHARAIAASPHCSGLFWGGEDLIAGIGGRRSRNASGRYLPVVELARSSVLLAAAAAGVPAIDAVHVDIGDAEGLRRESEEAVDMGFSAKACIHPSHVDVIRDVFRSTPEQLAWATEVLAAAEAHGGVFNHRGQMIDGPLLSQARNIMANRNNRRTT